MNISDRDALLVHYLHAHWMMTEQEEAASDERRRTRVY
jgi:hypothetical protein